ERRRALGLPARLAEELERLAPAGLDPHAVGQGDDSCDPAAVVLLEPDLEGLATSRSDDGSGVTGGHHAVLAGKGGSLRIHIGAGPPASTRGPQRLFAPLRGPRFPWDFSGGDPAAPSTPEQERS